jgi:hypothetical protein
MRPDRGDLDQRLDDDGLASPSDVIKAILGHLAAHEHVERECIADVGRHVGIPRLPTGIHLPRGACLGSR